MTGEVSVGANALDELSEGDDVVLAVRLGTTRTHGVIEIDLFGYFTLLVQSLLGSGDPLGSVFEWAFENLGIERAGESGVLKFLDLFGDGEVVLAPPGRGVVAEHEGFILASCSRLLYCFHQLDHLGAHVEGNIEETTYREADKEFVLEGEGLVVPALRIELGTAACFVNFTCSRDMIDSHRSS